MFTVTQPPNAPPPLPPAVLPYAVPLSNQSSAGGPWREGSLLVTTTFAQLPHVCVKCNVPVLDGAAGGKRLTQKYTWHHPALYFLILPGVLIYAIVALVLQKKATVELSLCPAHNSRRVKWLIFTWVSVLGGLGLVAFGCAGGMGMAKNNDMWPAWTMLAGALIAIVGGIVAVINGRVLTPRRIDDRHAWFKGASPDL